MNYKPVDYFEVFFSPLRENPGDTMAGIAERLVKNARSAGTNFHAVFQKANKTYDRIIILSDMQGWMQGGAPMTPFAEYCRKYRADPFVFSFDLQGYGSLQFPEQKVFALAGFSDKVFDIMQLLETDRLALIREIEKMEFEGPTIEEYFNPNKKFEDYVYMLIMDIDKFHPDSVIIKSNSYKEIKKHLGI
jgi:hypothetical protein